MKQCPLIPGKMTIVILTHLITQKEEFQTIRPSGIVVSGLNDRTISHVILQVMRTLVCCIYGIVRRSALYSASASTRPG